MLRAQKALGAGLAVAAFLLIAYYTLGRLHADTLPSYLTNLYSNSQQSANEGAATSLLSAQVESAKAPLHSTQFKSTTVPSLDLPISFLRGRPSLKFRDNLRNDTKYITSWPSAGWTNDVITYANLVYLALKTRRVPIIGVFPTGQHTIFEKNTLFFGDVFDVPRLSKSIGLPILEWRDVKDSASTEIEELGCWGVWPVSDLAENKTRPSNVPDIIKIDVSYTDAPKWVRISPEGQQDNHVSFAALASLAFPETRKNSLRPARQSSIHHVTLPPDDHLLCYDYLFYASDFRGNEYETDYYPAWHQVLQYLRWLPELETIAEAYVRRTFNTPEGDPTPFWITIHMRRGDFFAQCWMEPKDECFAPISVIDRRVKEVQQELLERKGIKAEHVIMTSDELSEEWWKQVTDMGWYRLDHSKTEESYNHWYTILIDAVIQSNGWGFVGTEGSTMSVIAQWRVKSWREGAIRLIKWKYLDADHH